MGSALDGQLAHFRGSVRSGQVTSHPSRQDHLEQFVARHLEPAPRSVQMLCLVDRRTQPAREHTRGARLGGRIPCGTPSMKLREWTRSSVQQPRQREWRTLCMRARWNASNQAVVSQAPDEIRARGMEAGADAHHRAHRCSVSASSLEPAQTETHTMAMSAQDAHGARARA